MRGGGSNHQGSLPPATTRALRGVFFRSWSFGGNSSQSSIGFLGFRKGNRAFVFRASSREPKDGKVRGLDANKAAGLPSAVRTKAVDERARAQAQAGTR